MTSSTGGISDDNGSDIMIGQYPGKPTATSNSPVCIKDTLDLVVTNNTAGVTYTWTGPDEFSGYGQVTSRTDILTPHGGNYIVSAGINGCIMKDTVSVSVHPPTPKPTAGANNPACVGGDINFTASQVNGAMYTWGGPVLFYANTQNPKRTNVLITHKGKYWVTATLNGCSSEPDSVDVDVVPGPEVQMYPNPGDTICYGWDVTFVAVPKNAGGTPTYEWHKNGISTGGTGVSYKASGVMTGDTFYVKMTAGTQCNTSIMSKPLRMTVLPTHTPPTCNITATPGTHVWPYVEVTFKAVTVNAGSTPGYQWKRNGADIPNSKDNILKMTSLVKGDTICCVVTSNHLCAVPREVKSNCLVMNVDLSVASEERERDGDIEIYPNPNNGYFTLKTKEQGIFHITDIRGQMIAKYEMIPGDNRIQLPTGTAKGIYIVKFCSASGITQTLRIVYTED